MRVSRFLIDHFVPVNNSMCFRSTHLYTPFTYPQSLLATGYPLAVLFPPMLPFDAFAFPDELQPWIRYGSGSFRIPNHWRRRNSTYTLNRAHLPSDWQKIARYGGCFIGQVHPNSMGLQVEKAFIDKIGESAWYGTIRDFGLWWAARKWGYSRYYPWRRKTSCDSQCAEKNGGTCDYVTTAFNSCCCWRRREIFCRWWTDHFFELAEGPIKIHWTTNRKPVIFFLTNNFSGVQHWPDQHFRMSFMVSDSLDFSSFKRGTMWICLHKFEHWCKRFRLIKRRSLVTHKYPMNRLFFSRIFQNPVFSQPSESDCIQQLLCRGRQWSKSVAQFTFIFSELFFWLQTVKVFIQHQTLRYTIHEIRRQ